MPPPDLVFKETTSGFHEVDPESCQLPLSAAEESNFTWVQLNELLDLIAGAIFEMRKEWRGEIETKLRALEQRIDALRDTSDLHRQIGELRGMVRRQQ